jgi:hypothetical protein
MNEEFKKRWLVRFGLSAKGWRKEAGAHLTQLPFSKPRDTEPLIEALFERVPKLVARRHDPVTVCIAEAFAWCCFSFWQCGSGFPAFPENYAAFFKTELFKANPKRQPEAETMAGMVAEWNMRGGQCGFNKLALADAGVVRESEHRIHEGGYEFYLKAKEKYDEYHFYLRDFPEFQAEWQALKAAFPKPTSQAGIIHRTLLPERNWERGPGAQFDTAANRFQAIFDLFCWKYFLWGMRGDEPLLMKPSVVFTPLGTQIFIPGYLSLDGKRDFDFGKINRIHKARGMARQGRGFSVGRQVNMHLKKKARLLDAQARQMGLKGRARYEYVARHLRIADGDDFRGVRKLLRFF